MITQEEITAMEVEAADSSAGPYLFGTLQRKACQWRVQLPVIAPRISLLPSFLSKGECLHLKALVSSDYALETYAYDNAIIGTFSYKWKECHLFLLSIKRRRQLAMMWFVI